MMRCVCLRDLPRLVASAGLGFLATSCKTEVVVDVKNATQTPVDATVWVRADESSAPAKGFQRTIEAGGLLQTSAGEYPIGSIAEMRISLQQGGVVRRAIQGIPRQPDPLRIPFELTTLGAENLDLTNAAAIEQQITDVTGSVVSPTSDIGTLITSSLGCVYSKTDLGGGVFVFHRVFDNIRLQSAVSQDDFLPPSGPPGRVQLTLTADKSTFGSLSVQVPNILDVKADFSKSLAYKFEYLMNNTAWRITPKSWNSVQANLKQTEDGKAVLAEVAAACLASKELWYLDSAYVLGDVSMNVFRAESIGSDVDISKENFIQANGAYKWNESTSDRKSYQNLVLRVRYERLTPQALMTIGGVALMTPLINRTPNGSYTNLGAELLASKKLNLADVQLVSSRVDRITPDSLARVSYDESKTTREDRQ